jgi:hypothetical protein
MGESAQVVILYTIIILYLFFKFIVMFHAIKNKKGYFWMIAVLIPGVDLYYYFKHVKN